MKLPPIALRESSGARGVTSFSRNDCRNCGPETLHRSGECVHCGEIVPYKPVVDMDYMGRKRVVAK